jgi:hypothetical protein
MQYYKKAIYFSVFCVIVLFTLSFFISNDKHFSIIVGLFTGFFVTLTVSIIGYFNSRKIVLKQLYVITQYWFSKIEVYPLTNVSNYNFEEKADFVKDFIEPDILGIRLLQEEVSFFNGDCQTKLKEIFCNVNKTVDLFREVKNAYLRNRDNYLQNKTIIDNIKEIDKILIYMTPEKEESSDEIDENEIPRSEFNSMPNNKKVAGDENARYIEANIKGNIIIESRYVAVYPKFKSEFESEFIKHFGKIAGIIQQNQECC